MINSYKEKKKYIIILVIILLVIYNKLVFLGFISLLFKDIAISIYNIY